MRVESFVRVRFFREECRSEFNRPINMTFKSADEKQIRRHTPIRFLASGNFMELLEKFREKGLDAFFNFRAGNVFGLFKIKTKIKFPHPPIHYWQMPFFSIKQNELVDVPSEEKLRPGTGCFLKSVVNQIGVVSGVSSER